MKSTASKVTSLKAAFPHTVPVLAGFLFLGTAYGIYMNVLGFNFLYPTLMGIVIFGGSLQFVAATMLTAAFAPMQTFVAALIIQARHLFYGISLLEKYKGTGAKKPYLIYAMCDESFSINCSVKVPDGIDKGWFMFFVSLLNQSYWVIGSALGGLLGELVTFDTKGLDFVMTAMFAVILLESLLKKNERPSCIIGIAASAVCLAVFGADDFLIPSMALIFAVLALAKGKLSKEAEGGNEK